MSYWLSRFVLGAALSASLLSIPLAAGTTFTTSWLSPGIGRRAVAGQPVAVVAMIEDQALRASVEEAMARALSARGATGQASIRAIPSDDLKDRTKVQAWFQEHGVKAVVTLRFVSAETAKTLSPAVWTTHARYRSFHDYQASVESDPAPRRAMDAKPALELLAFAVQDGGLAWAATCVTTESPRLPESFARSLADEALKRMVKQGLVAKGK